jgi:hypothetical protein
VPHVGQQQAGLGHHFIFSNCRQKMQQKLQVMVVFKIAMRTKSTHVRNYLVDLDLKKKFMLKFYLVRQKASVPLCFLSNLKQALQAWRNKNTRYMSFLKTVKLNVIALFITSLSQLQLVIIM